MKYALGNMLNGAGGLNPDGLSLDLQFATDKTLTARKGPTPVFTRASTATFVESDGLIQSAAINAARFDHDPITLACKGLLIEESRTNNCYNSNLLTTASWLAAATTVASDDAGPDGTTAYEISETTASAVHALVNSGSNTSTPLTVITSGVAYTQSVFLKKSVGSVDWIQLTFTGGSFVAGQFANFNLSTGTVGNLSGVTSRIEKFPNEWYRCSITATATSATSNGNAVIVQFTNNTNTTVRGLSYSGSTSNKILVAMGQLEAGSFPTSYIPTTTASLARSADVCSITAGAFSGFYNNSAGTIVAAASANGFSSSNNAIYGVESGTTIVTRVNHRSAQTNRLSSQVSATILTPAANYNSTNVVYKSALAADVDGADFVIDGTQIPDAYTGSVLTADNLKFTGMSGSTSNTTISSIRYYKKRLPVAKLQTLTV